MNPEKNSKRLTQWLLAATVVLLALVLGLQLWQMFGPGRVSGAGASAPAGPALSSGKAAMIEDVRALNGDLSAGDLAELSAEELEQLWKTGAPGLPIGVSAAARAAEEYAGTLAVDSVTSETDPELDEAPAHYEVELRHPVLGDFEYKVDAYTGEVLEGLPDIMQSLQAADAPQEIPEASSGSRPAEAQAPEVPGPVSGSQAPAAGTPSSAAGTQPPGQAPAGAQNPPSETPSGEEAAKNAAFAHAGVSAADVTAVRCKLDWEDGRQVYDIEFWAGGTEYDYEIDAAAGTVLKSGQEWGGSASGGQGALIGEEAAKNAALAHAGVGAQDVDFIRWELDRDDGVQLYEIEFTAGGAEYEYEIDAVTGAVLKAEAER